MKSLFLSSYFTEVKDLFVDYIKDNTKERTVTFIPTAANPEELKFFVDSDMDQLLKCGFKVEVLDISLHTEILIEKQINKNEFLFISGGNTFYLLQEIKRKNVDRIIKDFIDDHKTYIGSSAGSVILSKNISYIDRMDDKTIAKELHNNDSIGIIDFCILPHYKCEPFKKVADEIYEEYMKKTDIRALTNNQAIIYVNDGFITIGD